MLTVSWCRPWLRILRAERISRLRSANTRERICAFLPVSAFRVAAGGAGLPAPDGREGFGADADSGKGALFRDQELRGGGRAQGKRRVHSRAAQAIKYGLWASTKDGNQKLDKTFDDTQDEYPIYLFYR